VPAVNHRFALSNPALLSALSKKSVSSQFSDLGVQRLHIHDRLCGFPAGGTENIGRAVFELRFPRCDLVGMNVELLRKLRKRPIAFDGRNRHFRFESRCVIPARSSLHGLS
jgi:hypothetical protein